MKTALLVDGNWIFYRAWLVDDHGRSLAIISKSGEDLTFLYRFFSLLSTVWSKIQPTYYCLVFDAPGPNFRQQISSSYKRDEGELIDMDRVRAIEACAQVSRLAGIPVGRIVGVEGDDTLASLARYCSEGLGSRVIINTGDKDMQVCVTDQVTTYDDKLEWYGNPSTVLERYGVHPYQISEYLALKGDEADSIEGLAHVGPKTAAKYLATYGTVRAGFDSLEGDYSKAPKAFKNILTPDGKARLITNLKLAKVKEDVFHGFDADSLVMHKTDPHKLVQLLKDLGFQRHPAILARAVFTKTGLLKKAEPVFDGELPWPKYASILKGIV